MTRTRWLRAFAATLAIIVALGVLAETTSIVTEPKAASAATEPPSATSTAAVSMVVSTSVAAGAAYAAAVTSTCPSTDPNYYRDREWTMCLWGAEGAWAASLYQCVAGIGKYHGVQWYTMRACQDWYLIESSTIPFGLKYWYVLDLYKVAVYEQSVRDAISYVFGLYVAVFDAYGTSILPGVFCGAAVASMTGVVAQTVTGVACGYAWSYVHDQVRR